MPNRSNIDRARVIGLARQGKGQREIMRATGLGSDFVSRWMKRPSTEDLRRTGRPSKVTAKVVSAVRKIMKGRQRKSLRKVAGILQKRNVADVGYVTVRTAARTAALKPYRRQQKARLTDAQRATRMRFAKTYSNYDWTRVFFTDETTIVTHGRPNRQNDRIWAESADQVPPIETSKFSSSVKFWGGIGYYGKSDLVVCEKPFNSNEYIRVLKKGLRHVDSRYEGNWSCNSTATRRIHRQRL